jgi:hypothetical protein
MTESEWLTATDPRLMLESMRGDAVDRLLRLFVCACYRRAHGTFHDDVPFPAELELAEQFAERQLTKSDLLSAGYWLGALGGYSLAGVLNSLEHCLVELDGQSAAEGAATLMTNFASLFAEGSGAADTVRSAAANAEMRHSATLLRCIFGNPFRPVTFSDSWRYETAVALATNIYAERAFDRLPILADALEDAGCDDADVLNHLRGPGPHARGCWVVDGVLGKC